MVSFRQLLGKTKSSIKSLEGYKNARKQQKTNET